MGIFSRSQRRLAVPLTAALAAGLLLVTTLPGTTSRAGGLDTWTIVTPPVSGTPSLNGAACGASGTWVVVGESGVILSSENVTDWVPQTMYDMFHIPVFYTLRSVAFGDGRFVAVGNDVIATATESAIGSWELTSQYTYWLNSVCYGNGRFVAVGGMFFSPPVPHIATSPDGITWTTQSCSVSVVLSSVAFGNGRFVATAYDGTVVSSPDGQTWTRCIEPSDNSTFLSVAFGNGLFIAGSWHGLLRSSPDGINWGAAYSGPSPMDCGAATYGGGCFAVGGQYAGIATSANGVDWTVRHEPDWTTSPAIMGIGYGNGRFVATSALGTLYVSDPATPSLTITVTPPEAGTTDPEPGVHNYASATSVTLTASANSGYRFLGWSGDLTAVNPTAVLRVDAPRNVTARFEQKDPLAGSGSLMVKARMGHASARLEADHVAVFGGHGIGYAALAKVEVWDREADSFSEYDLVSPFDDGAIVRLADGRFLLAGGGGNLGATPGRDTAQVFSPGDNTTNATAGTLVRPRMACRGALLTGGKVLIAGGLGDPQGSCAFGELYDPATGTFSATGALRDARSRPLVLPMSDGRAVVAGGQNPAGTAAVDSIEQFDPTTNQFTLASESLFADQSGWVLLSDIRRDVSEQRTAAGNYVFAARKTDNGQIAVALFSPVTGQFTRLNIAPPLPVSAAELFPPLVDRNRNTAVFLIATRPPQSAAAEIWPVSVNLTSGKRSTSPVTVRTDDYWVGGSAATLLSDGVVFVTGGTTGSGALYDHKPVRNSQWVSLGTASGSATVIDRDRSGYRMEASNHLMVRDSAANLHVAFTAARVPYVWGSFAYVSSSSDDGMSWGNPVRTDYMAYGVKASSLVVDSGDRLFLGSLFVGSLVLVSASSDGGATWPGKTAPFWTYDMDLLQSDPTLAVSGSTVVLAACRQHLRPEYDPNTGTVASATANVFELTLPEPTGRWSAPLQVSDVAWEWQSYRGCSDTDLKAGPGGQLYLAYDVTLAAEPTHRFLQSYTPAGGWGSPVRLSDNSRDGFGGDLEVDSQGRVHIVWLERNSSGVAGTKDFYGRLCYTVYDPGSAGVASPRMLTDAEVDVVSATVGVYAQDRVLIAYDLRKPSTTDPAKTESGGVWGLASSDGFSLPLRLTDNSHGRAPGLRSSFGMQANDVMDLTWVEPDPKGGERLLYRELGWDFAVTDTGSVTVTSGVADAPFTLGGPRVFAGSTGSGMSVTFPTVPVGTYTVTWGEIPGRVAPDPETREVRADAMTTFVAAYPAAVPVWLSLNADPVEHGRVALVPAGTPAEDGRYAGHVGQMLVLSATPAEGFRFRRWVGTVDAPWAATTAVRLAADTSVSARFVPADEFYIDTVAGEHGRISDPLTVAAGARAEVTITPDDGFEVMDVIVDGTPVGAVSRYAFASVAADHQVTALFTAPRRGLAVDVDPPFTGVVIGDKAVYADGETAEVTAKPATGWRFNYWSGSASGTEPTVQVPAGPDTQVIAHFVSLTADVVPGDAVPDQVVDVRDAVRAFRMATALTAASAAADMDGTGTVTASDAARILRAAVQPVPLSSVEVEPDAIVRTVAGADGIRVSLPPGLLTAALPVVISAVNLDPPPPVGLTSSPRLYRVAVGGLDRFDPPILVEMPVDPQFAGAVAADPQAAVWVGAWDERTHRWLSVDGALDATRSGVAFLTERPVTVRQFLSQSATARAAARANPGDKIDEDPPMNDYFNGDYFQIIYNTRPRSQQATMRNATVGGQPVAESTFAATTVAPGFQRLYLRYQELGYPVKRYARSRPTWFGVNIPYDSRASVTLVPGMDGAEWSPWTGNYTMATAYNGVADLEGAVAHELFHMIQNQTWPIAAMVANYCLMDMTAEYARTRVALTQSMTGEYTIDFADAMMENGFAEPAWLPKPDETPPEGSNDIHRYAMVHFLDFLFSRGANFVDMYQAMRASLPAYRNWAVYVSQTTGRSLENQYRDFLLALLTDADWSSTRVPRTPIDSAQFDVRTRRFMRRPGWTQAREEILTAPMVVPHDSAMSTLWYRLVNGTATDRVMVIAEVVGGVPINTIIDVTHMPENRAVAGGIPPVATFYPGQTERLYTAVPVTGAAGSTPDTLYVTAYGGRKGHTAVVRLSPLQLTMRPAALPAAAFNQLYNFSAEVGSLPPAIKAVEVRWNFDDGSDEFSFYRTYPNGPPQPAVYTVNHRFTQGSKRAFNVSFSLRDRVLDRILAQGSCPVGIASGTRITLSPPVLYATAGATVSFAPELFDPPTTPQLTWNFGDSSGPQTTSSLTVAHPYAGADTYTVSVELADAASPAAVLARATCRVEISALPTDEPCPCTCGTGLNYSALERVQNWTNGETLEEYYIDGAGRKQGLYKVFSSKDGGNQYLWQCRCYVDDRLEGWWFWYHDNGAKSSEEYYVNGMRNGPWRGWSRGGSLLWESTWVNDAKEGHEVLKDDDGTVLIDQDWPVAHPDGPFVEHWPSGDNVRKEECTFAGGRRQGLYSYWSAAGVLLLRGEFAAGLKTGDWTYYRADGTSQTINYGNQP